MHTCTCKIQLTLIWQQQSGARFCQHMATIKLVHWSTTRFHPFNQHLPGVFMRTLPGGRLSMLPKSSGILPCQSPASGGIVVTVQHNLPSPSSPVNAVLVGLCIAPESVPVILRTRPKMTTKGRYLSFTSAPPVTNAWVSWLPWQSAFQAVCLPVRGQIESLQGAHSLLASVSLVAW